LRISENKRNERKMGKRININIEDDNDGLKSSLCALKSISNSDICLETEKKYKRGENVRVSIIVIDDNGMKLTTTKKARVVESNDEKEKDTVVTRLEICGGLTDKYMCLYNSIRNENILNVIPEARNIPYYYSKKCLRHVVKNLFKYILVGYIVAIALVYIDGSLEERGGILIAHLLIYFVLSKFYAMWLYIKNMK